MAEVPFGPARQLSEYKGKGASASREGESKLTVVFKSLGSIPKVYPRSNLTQIWPKLCSKTILSRAKIFLCERIGQIRLFW